MIIILTNKYDITADFVVRLLRRKGQEFLRINTEDLIKRNVSVNFPNLSYFVQNKHNECNLANNLKSVWFRRPGKPFEFIPSKLRPEEQVLSFVENQWHAFIEGLRCIENVLWINDPAKNHDAENKIRQLNLAEKMGFLIPKTCITSDKKEALEFFKRFQGKVIAKTLYTPLIQYPDKDYFVFTTNVQSIDEIPEDEFSLAPTIFQESLTEKKDYRVTVIGNKCFAVRIESSRGGRIPIDWRLEKEDLRFNPCKLPSGITRRCIEMVRKLGLVFGAIDLAECSGKFYFLEINPNGEWGWLQTETNLPIAETLVDYLMKGCGV